MVKKLLHFETSETMQPIKKHHFPEDLNLQDHSWENPTPHFPPGPTSLGSENYHSQIHLHIPMRSFRMYVSYGTGHRDHVLINLSCHTLRQTNKQTYKHSIKLAFKWKVQLNILFYMGVYWIDTPRDETKLRTTKNNRWGQNIWNQRTGIRGMEEITNFEAVPRYRPRQLLSTAS
jgi:hypothetical protein